MWKYFSTQNNRTQTENPVIIIILGILLLVLLVVVVEVVYIYIYTHATKCHIISFEHNKGEILLNCLNI